MNSVKYGISTWDEIDTNKGGNKFNKEDYLKLNPGPNYLRVITKPAKYLVHKYKIQGSPGFGRNIRCTTDSNTCPLCKAGVKVSEHFYVGVIDRSKNLSKILDMGPGLAGKLKGLNSDSYWGTLTGYDINIKVNPQGGATNYHEVLPLGKSPLSAEDLKLLDGFNMEDLAKKCSPISPEKVREQMKQEEERAGKFGGVSSSSSSSDEEDDLTFPAVN